MNEKEQRGGQCNISLACKVTGGPATRGARRLFAQEFEQNEDGKMKAAMNV